MCLVEQDQLYAQHNSAEPETQSEGGVVSRLFDRNYGFHVMAWHVAEVGESSGTCRRKLKFDQALRRDDHLLEPFRTKLWGSVAAQGEVVAEEDLLGDDGMEFCIVIAESEHGLATVM